MAQISSDQISRIIDNNRHTKEAYNATLLPLQRLLIVLCLLNNLSLVLIFQRAYPWFLLSNLFLFLSLAIHGEFFIHHRPSVFYTLAIALIILLFTLLLLVKVFETSVIVRHYQTMKLSLEQVQ